MKIKLVLLAVLIISFQYPTLSGQNLKRDTTLFGEHQGMFEKMDFIPTEQIVTIQRQYKDCSATIKVGCDPYWISSLVSNEEYNEYLTSIKRDSAKQVYKSALPDRKLNSKNVGLINIDFHDYFTKPDFAQYPVLGLTWTQAQKFCDWKTKEVNMDLDLSGLPHEKNYRIPIQAEIELAKKFVDINIPRIIKADSNYNVSEIQKFSSRIDEWTGESFVATSYFKSFSPASQSDEIIIYQKQSISNDPFRAKNLASLEIGFRYVQTYRKVKNSE
jgi:hypothetical protein